MRTIIILIALIAIGCEPAIPSPYYEGAKVRIKEMDVIGTVRYVYYSSEMLDVSYKDNLGQIQEAYLNTNQVELMR
jgi:hypothetical protein